MSPTLSQRLFAHGGVYTLSRLVNRSIGILLIPLYAHLIGKEGYGMIDLLRILGSFLMLIFSQGLVQAWYRLRQNQKNREDLHSFETTIIWYLLASFLFGIAVLCLIGEPLLRWLTPGIPFFPFGLIVSITYGLLIYADLYERKLQAEQRPAAFAVFSGFRTLLTLVSVVLFVAGLQMGVLGKVLADMLSAFILSSAALILIRPGLPHLFARQKMKDAYAYGLVMVAHSMAVYVSGVVGRLILNMKLGLGVTGIFAMGFTLSSIVNTIVVALNQAYSPLFIRSIQQSDAARQSGNLDEASQTLKYVARSELLMTTFTSCACLLVTGLANELLSLLTTKEFEESWKVVGVLCAGYIVFSIYAVFNQAVFYDIKRAKYAPLISGTAAFVNIVLNLLLIPHLGMMGVAWATVASNSILAVMAWLIGRGLAPIPHAGWRWLWTLSLSGTGLAYLWWVDSIFPPFEFGLVLKVSGLFLFVSLVLLSGGVAPRHGLRFILSVYHRLSGRGS